jgi:predicted negative regulator of RcsB-dependent stress response
MRYSIMLQLVATITLIFLGTAALFAWLQYRPGPEEQSTASSEQYHNYQQWRER